MNRANSFTDLDDFTPVSKPKPKPDATAAIDVIAEKGGFPSRNTAVAEKPVRRGRLTGRNRQVNIKVTDQTAALFYRMSEERDLPLGALLQMALEALEREG